MSTQNQPNIDIQSDLPAVRTSGPEILLVPPTPLDRWLAERRKFIGGSEIYKLLNEKQYGKGCVRALGYEKTNTEPDYPEQLDDALLKRGHILEPVAAAMYEEETGRKLRRPPMDEHGFPKARISKTHPWAGVHADRLVLAGFGGVEETGTAEIKSRGEGPYLRILRDGLFPGDILQIQHGMFVNEHKWGPFITIGLFGGMPLKHFDVQRDEAAIDIIKREGDKFAETVWVKGELPPHPFASDDQRCKVCPFRMTCRSEELDAAEVAAVRAINSGKKALVQINNPALSRAVFDHDLLRAEIAEREEALELVDTKIKELAGEAGAVQIPGYGKFYVQPSLAPKRVDAKRLETEKPDVYASYLIPTTATGKTYVRTYPEKQ